MAKSLPEIIVNVISLGCAKNLIDTEVMCGSIVSSGMFLAENKKDANVCLVNTCSFIKDARREAEKHIREAIRWKLAAKPGNKRLVVVAGCLAQRFPEETARQFPKIDLMLGLDDVPNTAKLIKAAFMKGTTHEVSSVLPTYLYDHLTPRLTVTPKSYAYIKIAEGCNHQCAFCAIPLFRGRQRSRDIASIVTECRQLLDQGASEINLIAQDSSSYGIDRNDGASLASLLKECDRIDGDFWLRVLYTHPSHVSRELLDIMSNSAHVVPYLDMPIQHISTNVLKNMLRGMSGPQLREKLHFIRETYPSLVFRTTVLVGFPGETDEDFQELLDFVSTFKFDRLGAFAYSPEKGTPSETMPLSVPSARLAKQRRDLLLQAQATVSEELNKSLVGKELDVLLEEPVDARHWIGRTKGDAPDVDQSVLVKVRKTTSNEPHFSRVKVTMAQPYDLQATEL
ncbi:MAG: 30S ribosomal protein S12 methylthiotransferase RimO [Victivallales bacterium]|nr:30S ribosomal protein S12 methylthiotransferase RimO [Victivallales bacterium]